MNKICEVYSTGDAVGSEQEFFTVQELAKRYPNAVVEAPVYYRELYHDYELKSVKYFFSVVNNELVFAYFPIDKNQNYAYEFITTVTCSN